MDAEITIKNYRCFPDSFPAEFSVRNGFTAFIGPNNAGKSSLLRFFYEFRELFRQLSEPGFLQTALTARGGFGFPSSVADASEVFHKGNDRDIQVTVTLPRHDGSFPSLERVDVVVPRGSTAYTATLHFQGVPLDRGRGVISISRDPNDVKALQNGVQIGSLVHALPVFEALRNTLYIGSFRNPLNVGSKNDYYDCQIGQAFISAWRHFKTGAQVAKNEAAFTVERDIGHIFGYNSFQVNAGPDDATLQMFIDGKSFKLGEVGAGMAQFILVLANAAMKSPAYILVDEPELSLHPSLQIDFLTTLASYASEGVIYATHSLGLARATAPHIYSLRRQGDFETRMAPLESTQRLSEFLGEMSFGGYRELGFERVLLVEGRTDVTAVQQLLRLLGKDHQIVLLPLGGSALLNGKQDTEAQLFELTRISSLISALIDSERGAPEESLGPDRQAFFELCKKTGIACHVLGRRAIENYWTDRAVQHVKGSTAKALSAFEKPTGWRKTDNTQFARAMRKDELMATDLGDFLAKL
jgi:predicted ATPase